MTTLADIRQQYPEYADLSDDQLAHAFHDKFYADMPFDQFAAKIEYQGQPQPSAWAQIGKSLTDPAEFRRQLTNVPAWKRAAGLNARWLIEGAASPLALGANAISSGIAMAGGPQIQDANQAVSQTLDRLGFPRAQNAPERIAGGALRALGAATTTMGAGAAFSGSEGATGGVGQALTSARGMQSASALSGGASAETARERGYGPVGQIVGGIAGGMLPAFGSALLTAARQRVAGSPTVASNEINVRTNPTATGRGGGSTFGGVGPDESAGLTPSQQRVAARGREMGFRLTPGHASGSRALQQMEAKLESQPMTSGPFNALKRNNSRVLNRTVATALGQNADVVDETVLSNTLDDIQSVYRSVADDVPRQVDYPAYSNFMTKMLTDARGLVEPLSVTGHPLVQDIMKIAGQGSATGRQLQSLSSKLGRAAYNNMSNRGGNRDLGLALYAAKDYVDDLLAQGLAPMERASLDSARDRYRLLMLLTSRSSILNPSSGNVNGNALAAALQAKDRNGFLFGRNRTPVYEAARFSQAFKPIVGDSGTATRSPLMSPTDFVLSLPTNIAARGYLAMTPMARRMPTIPPIQYPPSGLIGTTTTLQQ